MAELFSQSKSSMSLTQIKNQLEKIPNIILKGVRVSKSGCPCFTETKYDAEVKAYIPKYHPNFSHSSVQDCGKFDDTTTYIGIGNVVIIDVDNTENFKKEFSNLYETLEGHTPKYLSRNKKGYHYIIKSTNAPKEPCKKIKDSNNIHTFDILNGKQATWCCNPLEDANKPLLEIDFDDNTLFEGETVVNDISDCEDEISSNKVSMDELPEEVRAYIADEFSECDLNIREFPNSYRIDLGKSNQARTCPFDDDVHIKNNLYLLYMKKSHKLIHKCWCCSGKSEVIKTFKIDFENLTDYKLACIFTEQFGDKFAFDGDNMYYYNGSIWENAGPKGGRMLYKYINKHLHKFLLDEYWDKDWARKDTKGSIIKAINNIQNNKTKQNIIKEIRNNVKKVEHFDPYWFIVQFNNKVLDLRTHEIKDCDPKYLSSKTVNYDYKPRNEEEITYFKENIINTILPDEHERKTYLQFLSTSLEGRTCPQLMIAIGGGRNGKGLLSDHLEYVLGGSLDTSYSHTCRAKLFQTSTFNSSTCGANPELASLDGRRFVRFNEPNKSEQLNTALIKKLTGISEGGYFNARKLYSNSSKCMAQFTLLLETNIDLKLDDTSGHECLLHRIIKKTFKNTFTEDERRLSLPNHLRMNRHFGSLEFKKKYAMSFIHILTDNHKDYQEQGYKIDIPFSIQQNSQNLIQESDPIYMLFDEKYEEDENAYITVKNFYNKFQQTTYYINMTKKQKRNLNYRKFRTILSDHNVFKHFYKEAETKFKGKRIHQPYLVGYKLKSAVMDISLSDDEDELN